MRTTALVDEGGVPERHFRRLSVWDPQPETGSPAGAVPPWREGEKTPLSYTWFEFNPRIRLLHAGQILRSGP